MLYLKHFSERSFTLIFIFEPNALFVTSKNNIFLVESKLQIALSILVTL